MSNISKHEKRDKIKWIITGIALVLAFILIGGLMMQAYMPEGKRPTDWFDNINKDNVAAVEYNPVFDEDVKNTYPIDDNLNTLNRKLTPFVYEDLTLFANKRITKIDIPIGFVSGVDENKYFTLQTIKQEDVSVGAALVDNIIDSYKIYIPEDEISDTQVEKWITIDLTDQFIYVGEDETLAFFSRNDTACGYYAPNGSGYRFYVAEESNTATLSDTMSLYMQVYTDDMPDLSDKTISILGDSISTYDGISNSTTNNNTVGNNAIYFPRNDIDDASETWWGQSAEATGMELLVNNSYSGSRVLDGNGAAYKDRCEELHVNNGAMSGKKPDVIAVYIGVNDLNGGNELGRFNKLSDVYKDEEYVTPDTVAEAYAIMVHKMTVAYENSDIFLFTLPENGVNKDAELLKDYNDMIKDVADYFGCYVVDLAGIEDYDYKKYTSDGLHPNETGMDLITDLFVRTMKGVYA